MLFNDLIELHTLLEIEPDNKAEDAKLLLMCRIASDWICQIINRPGMSLAPRTEFYGGPGTQKLLLRNRPVYTTPEPIVYLDEAGFYGSNPDGSQFQAPALVYGKDFCLDLKEGGQPSLSGILIRINQVWPRPSARQQGLLSPFLTQSFGNLKIVYYAGYTVDTLPADFRWAANLLVTRMRYFMPLGMETTSENYEDRSISIIGERKQFLLAPVLEILWPYRNWRF